MRLSEARLHALANCGVGIGVMVNAEHGESMPTLSQLLTIITEHVESLQ